MSSILTNTGAMTALRTLQNTNTSLNVTQNRVSTGMKVASAGDNAARWSVATTMRSDASAYGVLSDTHKVALAAVNLAIKSVDEMVKTMEDVKKKATEYQQAALNSDTDSTTALKAEILELVNSANEIAKTAEFSGKKLLDGGSYKVQTDLTTGKFTISGATVSNMTTNPTTTATVDTDIDKLKSLGRTLGAAKQRLDAGKAFMDAMNDALKTGTGALVDADMTEESARLQALQVQQQLGAQALSIANQAPQVLLTLFR